MSTIDIYCVNTGEKRKYPLGVSLMDIKDDFNVRLTNPILGALVNNKVKELSFVFVKNKKVEFKVAVPDQKLSKNIVTDGTKLTEIITNLLNNAFKFTEEGYVLLEYNIDEAQKRIVFNVKDSGIGIPDEFQKNIFKRFSKINAKGISANEA